MVGQRLEYHPGVLARFVLFAVTLLVVLAALFNLGVELLGLAPEPGPVVGWRAGGGGLPGLWVLATWALEALALTALFLLVDRPPADGGGRGSLLNGLLAAWIAWVFRGPLLVMSAVGNAGEPHQPWGALALRWFVLYTLAGLLLALLARRTLRSAPRAAEPDAAAAQAAPHLPYRPAPQQSPSPQPPPSQPPPPQPPEDPR